MITAQIKQLSSKFYNEMARIRHEIHQNPELGYEEHNTSRLIGETLEQLGITYQDNVFSTGVVGLIEGNGPGKTVLLRADMDALAIQEETEVPFKSLIPNRMHACGHDGHVAGLLGAAMILNEMKDSFSGNVKLVFQPAEESEGGALPMITAGVLENPKVDAAIGCHLWGMVREGTVQFCSGPMMAAPDTFRFRIFGKGGHGAYPHLAIDPIVLGTQAINCMQTIISRRINPLQPAVISVCSLHSGESHNVIPEMLEATGTVRTFDEEMRNQIPKEMEQILKGITEASGASYSFEYFKVFPPLVNDPQMAQLAHRSFAKIVGSENVNTHGELSMGGEDFSYFSTAVPSLFAFVGIAPDERTPVLHHNPKFQWEDRNLKVYAEGLAQIALDYLNEVRDPNS